MFRRGHVSWKDAVVSCIADNGGELSLSELYDLIENYVDLDGPLRAKSYGKVRYKKKVKDTAWVLARDKVLERTGEGCYAITREGKKGYLSPGPPPPVPQGEDHGCHNCGASLLGGNLGKVTSPDGGPQVKLCTDCARAERQGKNNGSSKGN